MNNLIFAIVALLLAFTPAAAQNWPMRPVTMVVPSAAGGALDVMGHLLAPRLSELLGQPLIVENVAGAGGMTGAALVAKSHWALAEPMPKVSETALQRND
jgi:tripartite-type tricarboxylate transporter receptor subunit TctC